MAVEGQQTEDERVYAFSSRKGRRQAVLMLNEHASSLSKRAAPLLLGFSRAATAHWDERSVMSWST
jgi:hypothetical protein